MPVMQLEGLSGIPRSQRLAVLGQRDAGGATWLTIIGMHLEWALFTGFITLLYLMLPQQLIIDMDWQKLLQAQEGEWVWIEHLSNLFYAFVLIIWEPVYVACGFTLYLNRRTQLEAWDIELVFRRLRQRLTGVAYALLLGLSVGLAFTLPSGPAVAEEATAESVPDTATAGDKAAAKPEEKVDPMGPDADRLLNQPLTSTASRDNIKAILDAPPFTNRETVTRWRLHEDEKPEKKKEELSQEDKDAFERFIRGLMSLGTSGNPSVSSPRSSRSCSGPWSSAWCCCWSGATANGSPPSSTGSACPPASAAIPPPSCSAWKWRPKACPTMSPPKPNASGATTPAKPSACSTAPCSAGCCTTSACPSRAPTPKAKCCNWSRPWNVTTSGASPRC